MSEQQSQTMAWGPHKSAHEFVDFLTEEMVDFIHKGQWVILLYKQIMANPVLCLHLRISPMGIMPQRGCQPHIIVDYSLSLMSTVKPCG
jgi:hypothetical protein